MPEGRLLRELSLADRNQAFLDAESKIDPAIQIRQFRKVSNWRTMIQRGTYTLGEGLQKKSYRMFPDVGQQRGLQKWHPVQISRKATAGDAGFDAAKYNPHSVIYGFDSVTYGGLGIEYSTPNISIRDLRFAWQIREQLGAIYGFLGDFTNNIWENYSREQYMKFANDADKIYVLGEGGPTSVTATYDPESVDSDGDNILTIAGYYGNEISTLDWDYFKYFSRYLQMQVPLGAIGNQDGRGTYGWVGDLEDFDKMIEKDEDLREDWRHARADMLIKGYGNTTEYKGYNLMHDMLSPRFVIKSTDGTDITLKRIDPYTSTDAALTGSRSDVNEAYLKAEFGTVMVFMKDVFQVEVPPAGPTSPGGGTNFGATPGLNGEWKWLNIQDPVHNPLNEIGFWFMRAEAFAKPLVNREEPIMVIYKRYIAVTPTDTDIGGVDVLATQDVTVNAVTADVDLVNFTVTLTLAGYLTGQVGDTVTVTDDSSAADDGVIADASAAPTYMFALSSTPAAYTEFTAAGGCSVSCT